MDKRIEELKEYIKDNKETFIKRDKFLKSIDKDLKITHYDGYDEVEFDNRKVE
jgi:hypothetical protein